MFSVCVCVSHGDVCLVDVVFATALGDEQHAVKEEERALVLGSVYPEGPLQDQLPIGGQIGTLPVQQQ